MQILNCACLHKQQILSPGKISCELPWDHSDLWVLFTKIELVSNEHNYDIRFSMLFNLFDPFAYGHEWLFFRNVVNNQCANWFAVMGRSDSFEALLASGVPYLSFNCPSRFQMYSFGCEFNTNRWVFVLRKLVLDVPRKQMCLTHSCITNQDH